MNEEPQDDELSARVARLLRDLPPRPAPPTLEARVRRQVGRRAMLSSRERGLRHGFRDWPSWGRVAFLVLSAALVGDSVLDTSWRLAARPLEAALAWAGPWLHPAMALMASAGALSHGVVRWVPPAWLAGLAGTLVMLYAMLFALGAAAYRTLYVQPFRLGDPA